MCAWLSMSQFTLHSSAPRASYLETHIIRMPQRGEREGAKEGADVMANSSHVKGAVLQ